MRDWPHSPVHRLAEPGAYIVTAGTYLKKPTFAGPQRLEYLCDRLLELAEKYEWQLQAWAVFPNHYHFVALFSRAGCLSYLAQPTSALFNHHPGEPLGRNRRAQGVVPVLGN